MSDIKLFRVQNSRAAEVKGQSLALEKTLQRLIESNLDHLFAIRFLASEFSTGKTHGGRIDTLGVDENACPVVLEYKRSVNENVITQGLYYLDWLLDHRAEFKLLVMEKCGPELASQIEWDNPRLLCIAGEFNKYDEYAVQQINRNIELIRYRWYPDGYLIFQLLNAISAERPKSRGESGDLSQPSQSKSSSGGTRTFAEQIASATPQLLARLDDIKDLMTSLGDDVQVKELKYYVAFKRLKNFASLYLATGAEEIVLFLNLDPDNVKTDDGFTRDVRGVGHWGSGDVQIRLKDFADLHRAERFIRLAYDGN